MKVDLGKEGWEHGVLVPRFDGLYSDGMLWKLKSWAFLVYRNHII